MNDPLQDRGCTKKMKMQFIYITKINITTNWKRLMLSTRPCIFRFLQYSHTLTPTIKFKPISDFKYIVYVTVNSKVNTIFFSEYVITMSVFFLTTNSKL